jgi:hypothetical protein
MKQVYLHINNGGIIVSAGTQESTGQLMFRVRGTHFGNTTNMMEIFTNAESMQKIGEMLIKAANEPHEVYSFAALWSDPEVNSVGHEDMAITSTHLSGHSFTPVKITNGKVDHIKLSD